MVRATTRDERARVYIEHTDAYGVVFYANYLAFASNAAEALGRAGGFDFARAFRCVKIEQCRYARAATLGDAVAVRSEVMRADERSATLRQEIVSANDDDDDETVYVDAEITYARAETKDGAAVGKLAATDDGADARDGAGDGTFAAPWEMEDGRCASTAVRMYRGERFARRRGVLARRRLAILRTRTHGRHRWFGCVERAARRWRRRRRVALGGAFSTRRRFPDVVAGEIFVIRHPGVRRQIHRRTQASRHPSRVSPSHVCRRWRVRRIRRYHVHVLGRDDYASDAVPAGARRRVRAVLHRVSPSASPLDATNE